MRRDHSHRAAIHAVGRAVFELRAAVGWSQAELARRAGVSQPFVSRVESSSRSSLTFAAAGRLLEAMGARLTVGIDRPYLGERHLQRDAAHVRCVGHVARRLESAGWSVAREVEVGGDRSRGWIDILAFHAGSGLVLVIEVKSELRDLGQIERTLGWYEREAWAAARRLGWRPRAVVGALLLLATEENDVRVRANREALAAAFLCARPVSPRSSQSAPRRTAPVPSLSSTHGRSVGRGSAQRVSMAAGVRCGIATTPTSCEPLGPGDARHA